MISSEGCDRDIVRRKNGALEGSVFVWIITIVQFLLWGWRRKWEAISLLRK